MESRLNIVSANLSEKAIDLWMHTAGDPLNYGKDFIPPMSAFQSGMIVFIDTFEKRKNEILACSVARSIEGTAKGTVSIIGCEENAKVYEDAFLRVKTVNSKIQLLSVRDKLRAANADLDQEGNETLQGIVQELFQSKQVA